MATPVQLPHEWSKDALLAKAQRYAEEMRAQPREGWQFAFWSSLSLELLARAALANVSPTLVADHKDWNNIYFALGNTPTVKKFSPKSLDISSVLNRLQEIVSAFTPEMRDFALLHMGRRNQELHSGGTPFDSAKASAWLPMFYHAAEVLLASMNEKLETLFGPDEAMLATELIAAANDASAKAVAKTIHDHKTVWSQFDADERAKRQVKASAWATRQEGHGVSCPSCSSDALVTGSPMAPPVKKLDGDEITETQYFLPSRFECVACGLKVNGLSQLHAAALADTYKATFTYDAAEYYQPYDPLGAYEPDFNEP
jgi:hypothetical protein